MALILAGLSLCKENDLQSFWCADELSEIEIFTVGCGDGFCSMNLSFFHCPWGTPSSQKDSVMLPRKDVSAGSVVSGAS